MEHTLSETPQRKRKIKTVLVLLSVTLVLSLVIIGAVLYFNKTTKLSNMVLTKNSLAFSIWKRSDTLVKVHLFNYTNWQRVKDELDDRLHVEDVDPYVYKQQTEKFDVKFDGDKLSFRERNSYKVMSEKTTEQSDEVNVPNLPLIMLVLIIVQNKVPPQAFEEKINEANHPYAFLKTSAERLLWGYQDDIAHLGSSDDTNIYRLLKNDSVSSTILTINTGEKYRDRMNLYEKVDGRDHLPYWDSSECNSIEGTDGFIFPPTRLDRVNRIYVFNTEQNRRIAFKYERDVEMSGIQLMRYRMQRNAYDDPSTNPANQCYCVTDTRTCRPKGIFDPWAWEKTKGSQLISLPHFSLGDPKLTEDITGMKPNPDLYENYIDLHPTLGIALRGKTSWQLNIEVRKDGDNIRSVSFLPDRLITPIAWFSKCLKDFKMSSEFEREDLIPLISSSSRFAPPTKLILAVISIVSLFIGLG